MSNIKQYFFPPRKLHQIPRHISAEYGRSEITSEQAIIMMAGLARDPEQAQQVYAGLKAKYGKDVWKHVDLEVRRLRNGTFSERLMKLMRKIFGENETMSLRQRKEDAVVLMNYRIEE
jgi:protoporphyrinogen oxidase